MNDLTRGKISAHILSFAASMTLGYLAPIAVQFVCLYFIARIGVEAVAGVSAATNVVFVMAAISQMLSIGMLPLIAHAVGRRDRDDVLLIFNQGLVLAGVCGISTLALVVLLARPYLSAFAAEEPSKEAGYIFVLWSMPGYVVTFVAAVFTSTLRGAGVVLPTVAFQTVSVMIQAMLTPILVAGWGTGSAHGVSGAGLASSISMIIGASGLVIYCRNAHPWIAIKPALLMPRSEQWWRILRIGLPAGCDFALFFVYVASVYFFIRDFGAAAQAGFGIGAQIAQVLALPGLAVGCSAGLIAGQNFGAGNSKRVKETFFKAAAIGTMAMSAGTVVLHVWAGRFVAIFDVDASVAATATTFISHASWALVAQGLVFTCAGIFQGLGNTISPLLSTGAHLVAFLSTMAWMWLQPAFRIEQVWYAWVATMVLQACVSLWLLNVEFMRRLPSNTTCTA